MGKTTKEEALRVLKEGVVLSNAMANQEVERYMYRSPGQAPSYFYGYTRLLQLRKDAQQAMGSKFNVQQYHDFVLSQGLLPPNLLRKAVMEGYVQQLMIAWCIYGSVRCGYQALHCGRQDPHFARAAAGAVRKLLR